MKYHITISKREQQGTLHPSIRQNQPPDWQVSMLAPSHLQQLPALQIPFK